MKTNQSDWERALLQSPTKHRGFTPQLMKHIEHQAVISIKNTKKPKYRWIGGISVAVIAALLFVAFQQNWLPLSSNITNPNDSHLTGDDLEHEDKPPVTDEKPEVEPEDIHSQSNYFDPNEIQIGDIVKGWKVTSIQENYFDVPNGQDVMVSFSGEARVSGTFQYYGDDEPYNAGDIVLYLDEASTASLPIPIAYEPKRTTSIIVMFDQEEDKDTFGAPGTSGIAGIVISEYHVLMAEAYGGVIDSATFNGQLEVTAAYVAESYINMLANNDVLSILRLFPDNRIIMIGPGKRSDVMDVYERIYEQHDAAIDAYGDDAWENVTYTLEHEEHTDGRGGYIIKLTNEEITEAEYQTLIRAYWEGVAEDHGITFDQLFSFSDPDTDAELRFKAHMIYQDNMEGAPVSSKIFTEYDLVRVNLTFNNQPIGKDGNRDFRFYISNKSGTWQMRQGLDWDRVIPWEQDGF